MSDLLDGDNRRPPVLYDDLPNVVTLKPLGDKNKGDQWDIIHKTDMPSPLDEAARDYGITVINFTNRGVSLFSQFKNGKLLIGIVRQDQAVGV